MEFMDWNRANDIDMEELSEKTSNNEFTDAEWAYINEYEYGEEWLEREDELRGVSIDEYEEMRKRQDY